MLIETNSTKYVIPLQTEGDFFIGEDKYGAFCNSYYKTIVNHCQGDSDFTFDTASFFIFNRNYFISNPDYNHFYSECR